LLVIVATVAIAVVGALLYFRLETGFLPEMDEGGYVIDYVTPTGTSLTETDKMLKRLESVLQETPEVAGFIRRTGTEMGMFAYRTEHRRHPGPTQAPICARERRR
jgi:multidrug efflux pump subunit AcrB